MKLITAIIKPIKLDESCTVVMCSDGLSNLLDPGELLEVLEEEPLEEAAETLVELARQRGGPDNITLILARMQRS